LIDPVLEEEIRSLNDIIRMWDDLFAQMVSARAGKGASEDSAKSFLAVRDNVASRYAATMSRLEIVPDEQDELIQALGRMNSLGAVAQISDIQWKKLEEASGRVSIGLQSLVGVLQNRKQALSEVSVGRLRARRIFGSWPCKLLYLVVGIVIIFIVLSKIIVYTK
jgi:hypothetical protein